MVHYLHSFTWIVEGTVHNYASLRAHEDVELANQYHIEEKNAILHRFFEPDLYSTHGPVCERNASYGDTSRLED